MVDEAPTPVPPGRNRLGYVPALDGVRAIAALRVLGVHYFGAIAASSPFPGFGGGRLGMQVFFTLSGFVITVLLAEEYLRSGRIDLQAFWKRRLLRLLPALVFVIAVLILLGALVDAGIYPHGQGLREIPDSGSENIWLPFWPGLLVVLFPVSNLVSSLHHASFRPLAVAWMPAIQDQVYLVWPAVLALLLVRCRLHLRTCVAITAGLVVATLLWRSSLGGLVSELDAITLRTDFNLAGILLGCTGGLAYAAGMVPTGPRFRQVLAAAAWVSLLAILAIFAWGVQVRANDYVTVVGFLTLILVTHLVTDRTSRLSHLLSWPPLVGIGQVSYGLYLWHWVWLQYPLAIDRGTPVRLLIAVTLTVVMVLVSYYVIELPALRLKTRFAPRRELAPAGPAATSSAARLSRRNLLPVLGMGTMSVIAFVAFGMVSRVYPPSLAVSVAPPSPPPSRSPRPPRSPRQRRVARNRRETKRTPRPSARPANASRDAQAAGVPAGEE